MTIDYRRFLGRIEERVLAYLGGGSVIAADRALRMTAAIAPGWWRFSVQGRTATPLESVEAPEDVLRTLESAVGFWTGGRLVHGAAIAEPVHLLPEDELPRFAPCRARRWHSGDLVFERMELEGEAEEMTRRVFEDRAVLAGIKGVPGTLRAAFALAVIADVSARTGIAAAPIEVRADLTGVAERGWPAAEGVVERLRRERETQATRARERALRATRAPSAAPPRADDGVERATAALLGSGAALLSARALGGGLLEVTYRFLGERLRAVVLSDTLQVVDAGVCLAGHDRELTLASLPGAVREGSETGQLAITNHV